MKKLWLTFSFVLAGLILCGQHPQKVLQQLNDSFPQERIYIHYDKEVYLAGETVWFKAYLLAGFVPSDLSANFFIELINGNNQIILQKRFPILSGTAIGNLDLPDSMPAGNYLVRAYTPWMLNFDEDFLYRKSFFIYKPGEKNTTPVKDKPPYQVHFFPEGGDIVNGVVNVVAFRASDHQGLPVSINGRLLDETGNELTTFITLHDGMGTFGFLPANGLKYEAEVSFADGTINKYPMPMSKESGWALQVREENETRRRIILTKPGTETATDLVLVGQIQQHLIFEQSVQVQGNSAIISIDTRSFPSGILQLTVLTKNGTPLAERLLFINNNDMLLPVNLSADSISLKKKGKNVFSFSLPDSVLGSYSLSVVDDGKFLGREGRGDILSYLLLTSDLKGYIHNPSFYFNNNDKANRKALDLVMMTNGWRRFNWASVLKNHFPIISNRDKNHIQLSGTIFSARTKKPVSGGEANFILRTKDSLTDFFQVAIGDNGRFILDDLVYSDSAQFSFQLNSKKNREKELFIQLDKDTTTFSMPVKSPFTVLGLNNPAYLPGPDSLKALYTFSKDTSGNYRTLESITVIGKKKRPIEELNKRYTTGIFSSTNMVRILDLVNNEPGAGAQNVFQYIQGRIGGLRIIPSGNPPTYTIYSGRAMSLTGGPVPVPLFLDEAPTTSLQLATIPMNQVAMIKYFQSGFMGNPGIGSTQALVVYTRKASDLKSIGPGYLHAFTYPGYSPTKEFYAPDYEENPAAKDLPDRRITLLWQPDLKPDPVAGKYIIRFFNTDNTRRVRINLEGVTADGKLVKVEKLIE